MNMQETETLIIGAGPIGLELAAALKSRGADYIQIDAGQIGQTIWWYPRQVRFFSSPDRIAIAGVPIQTVDQSKASREEYLAYLRTVVEHYDLEVRSFERAIGIDRQDDGRLVVLTRRGEHDRQYIARHMVLAVGDMHRPRMLHIPGEDLEHVSHYFDDPHLYFRRRLLIVGGRNSAVEAAIRCHRVGAHVTLSHRREAFDSKAIKYWLLPEIEMLAKTGQVRLLPSTVPTRITSSQVTLKHLDDPSGRTSDIEAEAVLLLTGYVMDTTLFEMAGVELEGENRMPKHDVATMQTNVPGVYVAGTAVGGTQQPFKLFIENCHIHVDRITRALTGHPPPFDATNRTTAEYSRRIEQMPES